MFTAKYVEKNESNIWRAIRSSYHARTYQNLLPEFYLDVSYVEWKLCKSQTILKIF
jgi:hypothetical protein